MENKACDKRMRSSEAGIALILVAVTIVGLGTLATVLTIDVLRGKTAYSYAQSYADEICSPAAAALPFTAQVVSAVANKVPANLTGISGYMNIRKIRLITPMIVQNPSAGLPLIPFLPVGWSWPMTFSDFIPTHPCPASVCEFWGDVDADPILDTFFPSNFMTEVDYGQRAACVVEMEADTLILGKRYVVAKSASGLYVRGSNPSAQKSIIIGVAPQMEVTVPPEPDCGAQPFVPTRFSPVQDAAPYNLNPNNPVYRTCPVRQPATDPGGPNGSFLARSPRDFNIPAFGGIWNTYGVLNYPTGYPLVPLDLRFPAIIRSHIPSNAPANVGRREQQASVYNTVIAFRNRILENWVSKLAHMGRQRLNFQFLVINSQNEQIAKDAGFQFNPPTLVKGAGIDPANLHDPLNNAFIFPTVNRRLDATGKMNCAWRNVPGFGPWPPRNYNCNAEERAYLNQLKKGYHVFHQGGAGVLSLGDPSLANDIGGVLFEPASFVASPNPAPAYSAGDYWEQTSQADRVKLTELVRMLGIEQFCPNAFDVGACVPPAPGANPPVAPLPDLAAFIRYAADQGQAFHPIGPMWAEPAAPPHPFLPGDETPTINNPDQNNQNSSDIVIITSKPILDDAERDAIGNEVDQLHAARRITVLFLVLSNNIRQDASVMSRFDTAFRVGTRDSVIIRVAPDPGNPWQAGLGGCTNPMNPNDDTCLYNFYNGLHMHWVGANPRPPWAHNVTLFSEIADGIFDGRIAERRLAL